MNSDAHGLGLRRTAPREGAWLAAIGKFPPAAAPACPGHEPLGGPPVLFALGLVALPIWTGEILSTMALLPECCLEF